MRGHRSFSLFKKGAVTNMKIITLTLNPAFDIHSDAEIFRAHRENICQITKKDIGGKGINISRALLANGIESLAVAVLGKENAEDFRRGAGECGIPLLEIENEGRIRENITVHEKNAPETRISFRGFTADAELLTKLYTAIADKIESGDIVTLTGSLPDGLSMEDAMAFAKKLKAKGARIVIDSRSFSLFDIKELSPWLIKPNQEEISGYLSKNIENFEDALASAKALFLVGIENVMISLGEKGALLVCDRGIFTATPPRINALSTIGAGDSMIAGFILSASKGEDKKEALKTAVAFGSAACLLPGTEAPQREDIAKIKALVKLNEVK